MTVSYNPVALQLLAADCAARYRDSERFMLALEPSTQCARFVPETLRPWIAADSSLPMPAQSTPHDAYIAGISDVIHRLAEAGEGKAVISRVVVCDAPAIDTAWWCDMLGRLFATDNDSLRYVANTQAGLWIGATPERLISIDKRTGQFSTMALAGTRPLSMHGTPWDDKNIYENSLVGKYITGHLREAGASVAAGELTTLAYRDIEHLMQPITGSLGNVDATTAVDAINPTPALAGYPMDEALRIITATEAHDRGMYGGTITLECADRLDVYVNLRCCRISDGHVALYGGGGITSDSEPEQEWNEAASKLAAPHHIIFGDKPIIE